MTVTEKSVATNATCSAACWYAKQEECRCFCGGINHGILLTDGAEQPRRACTIEGVQYILGGVDISYSVASAWARLYKEESDKDSSVPYYRRSYALNGKDSYAWRKNATEAQKRWPEVAGTQNTKTHFYFKYLLWIRADAIDHYDEWAKDN